MIRLTADFETTTNPDDCRVWAYGLSDIENYSFYYGNSIGDLFKRLITYNESMVLYFHNLKFDGEFIFVWLFKNNYRHVIDKKELEPGTFTTLISDMGQFYNIDICYGVRGRKKLMLHIYDSLKIIPFSVDEIAKGFHLNIQKLEIDYHESREVGHELTREEIDYLKNDVEIVARALHDFFDRGLTKITQGSNALADYRSMVGDRWKTYFPVPKNDSFIRKAYKGGFTYLNPKYKGKDVGSGIVLDVNSLYPSRMKYCKMPYGEGLYFEGKYKKDKLYDLYFQRIQCSFKLKKNKLPTIQIKNNLGFIPTEYVTTTDGEIIELTLTSVDLKLFLEHYNVRNLEYLDGYKYKSAEGLFSDYIDKWTEEKIKAKKEGNHSMYLLSKLMLNALYGKLATSPSVRSKYPYYEDGKIKYRRGEKETREPIYIPAGAFITSYARDCTIRAAQSVYHRFIYADTDSLHLEGTEIPTNLEIDSYKLGAWDHEATFTRARYIRSKCYIEEINGKLAVTCAGLPAKCHDQVTWENFAPGATYTGKLTFSHERGGVILKDTTFTIVA